MRRSFPMIAMVLTLAGCGGGQEEPSVDPETRRHLLSGVEVVEAAAARRDRPAAEDALAGLHRAVASAQAEGKLDQSRAGTILNAAERVAEDVRTIPMPAPEPPVTITVPTPVPDEDEQQKEQGGEEDQREREEREREEDRERPDPGPERPGNPATPGNPGRGSPGPGPGNSNGNSNAAE